MPRYVILLLLAALVALAGCGKDGEDGSGGEVSRAAAIGSVEPGISRALAERRAAALKKVCYDMAFKLEAGAAQARGFCSISFDLKDEAGDIDDLIVDFGSGKLLELSVNGAEVPEPALAHDHIVIPGRLLGPGGNTINTTFDAPVGKGGTALTRFEDESDGSEYVYTLLVPADAHLLFPCFDQPDLKAHLTLALNIPRGWTAVSNAPVSRVETRNERTLVTFRESQRLSTYVMAFAAGPFERIDDETSGPGRIPMSLYVRPSKKDKVDAAVLFRLNRDPLEWCEEYFGFSYPFEKFEFVLVPGFPYGGMEHAGAIFYRETTAVFDQAPTAAQLLGRRLLMYHEVVHQWFGDLVTMAWFDDLWLKEGFATFAAYKMLDALDPAALAWMRFHQSVKPRAYGVDATAGTTPVYQELGNLYDAKSAYGAIVYNKAPALLRQLEFKLGEEAFRKGAGLCIERHALGNARWPEIFACFEEAAGVSLEGWLDAWLLTRGMPVVTVEWDVSDEDRIARFEVLQKPVRGEGTLWPVKTRVALWYPGGRVETHPVEFSAARHRVAALEGKPAPEFVFLNFEDMAYGRFLLDAKSLDSVTALLPLVDDPFLESLLLSALWDMVREAAFAPADYIDLALAELEDEKDAVTFAGLLNRVGKALRYYLGARQEAAALPRVEGFLLGLLEAKDTPAALRLAAFRAFTGLAGTSKGLGRLKAVLSGEAVFEGVPIAPRDRWRIVGRLVETDFKGAAGLFETEKTRGGLDADRYAFEARAGFPDPAVKKEYYDAYLTESDWPERWLEDSLDGFNVLGQSDITFPYLLRALDQLEWVKDHRKIFFMPGWIAAFISGHRSREALDVVHGFLEERKDLPGDIRLKVLQSVDDLERTVRIRKRWADDG